MPRGGLATGCGASTRGDRVAGQATFEASGWGRAERFYVRGGGHLAADHEPRFAALRQCCGLGRRHGAGLDVHHRPHLESGDLAGRVFLAGRLDGVDQVGRATLDADDVWSAEGLELYAEASLAEGRVILPNRCIGRQANR